MSDRERELERWIERARADAPSADQLARTRARLLSNIAGPPPSTAANGGGSNTPQAGATIASSGTSALALKIAAISVLLGAGAVALRASVASESAARVTAAPSATAPVEAPRPAPPALAATPEPEVGVAVPMPKTAAPPATHADTTDKPARGIATQTAVKTGTKTSANPSRDFAREVALLRAALEAHRRGDDAQARAKLADHEREYPNGALTQERKRLAAEIEAGRDAQRTRQ